MVPAPMLSRLHSLDPRQTAALKHELAITGGWFVMFMLMGVASVGGYILMMFFILLSIARLIKIALDRILSRLPKHSLLKHHARMMLWLAFVSLLVARACYIAAVIVDTELSSYQ
jgi:predicted PurR-regulated permease PerM